jgi:hypothetical protein
VEEGTSSAPKYASGTHPNPSFSSGESKLPLLSTSGGTELSWNPEGEARLIQPVTSTEIQPASFSKAKSVSWAPSKEVLLLSGEIYSEMLPPETKPLCSAAGAGGVPVQSTGIVLIDLALLDESAVSWNPPKEVLLQSGEIYSEIPPPEIKPLPLPPGPEGYQPKMAQTT